MPVQWMRTFLSLAVLSAAGAVAGADPAGLAELERAIPLKLSASTLGDLEEVIRLCESAQKKGLDEADAELAAKILGAALIQRGMVAAKIVQEGQASPALWPQLREHRDKSLSDLERGLKSWPDQPDALYAVAQLNLMPGGDKKRAAEAVNRAIELAEDLPVIRAKALGLRADLESDLDKKLADLERAIALAPSDPALVFARGMVRAWRKDLQGALDDFEKTLDMAPKSISALEAKAVVLAQLKRYDAAITAFDQLRELAPGSPQPMLQQARIYVLRNNPDSALHALSLAIEADPKCVDARLLRAEIWQQRGDKDLARSDLDAAIKLEPNNPGAVRLDAMLLGMDRKYGDAIRRLEPLAAKSPKDIATLLELAMFLAADRKVDRAIETYSKVIEIQPKNPLAWRNRGDLLLNCGKHAEAIADYERAMAIEPKDPGLLNNLAWVLATSPDDKLRNGERAVELALEACRLTDYKAAHILSTLAAAHAETGDFKVAIHWSERALAVTGADHKEALEKELVSYRDKKPWRERQSLQDPKKPEPSEKK